MTDIAAIVSSVATKGLSPAEAADQITATAPIASITELPVDGDDTPGAEEFFWTLWDTVIDSAQSHPASLDKLVEFVLAIGRPDRTQTRWRVWGSEMSWKDLPILGASARESFNGPELREAGDADKWVALNGFLARLTDADDEFMLYAIWSLRDALEEELNDGIAMNSAKVRAAAQWILYVGRKVYSSTEEFESGPLVGAPAKGGVKWDGKHGFDPGRWALWKGEFEILSADNTNVDELARRDARKAVEKMREIEKA